MQIDPAIFAICVGLVNLVVMIGGGVAIVVRLQEGQKHNRERFELGQGAIRELMDAGLKQQRELTAAEHRQLRELMDTGLKSTAEKLDTGLKALGEKLDDHIHDNREDLGALTLAQKADQAATANIHDATRENRIDIEGLKEWKREVTRRNGPQPPALGA